MDVGPGDLVIATKTYDEVVEGRICTIARIEAGPYWRGCVFDPECEGAAFWLCEEPSADDEAWCSCGFRPIRKPPIPAEILALQNTLPASPEPVPA